MAKKGRGTGLFSRFHQVKRLKGVRSQDCFQVLCPYICLASPDNAIVVISLSSVVRPRFFRMFALVFVPEMVEDSSVFRYLLVPPSFGHRGGAILRCRCFDSLFDKVLEDPDYSLPFILRVLREGS